MYDFQVLFRRIEEGDVNLLFRTGNPAFDEINPSGTLEEYYQADEVSNEGEYITFIVEKIGDFEDVIGLLRFREVPLEEFTRDLNQGFILVELVPPRFSQGNALAQ